MFSVSTNSSFGLWSFTLSVVGHTLPAALMFTMVGRTSGCYGMSWPTVESTIDTCFKCVGGYSVFTIDDLSGVIILIF